MRVWIEIVNEIFDRNRGSKVRCNFASCVSPHLFRVLSGIGPPWNILLCEERG